MNILQKLKSYKFWLALSGAIILFIETVGKELGIVISEEAINNIIMAFCGLLVVLGFVNDDRSTPPPTGKVTTE